MPLMRCPDCHKEISESAISCPNCGLPRPAFEQQSRARHRAEAEAHAERTETIRNLYIGAAVLGFSALALLGIVLFARWSRAALTAKGEETILVLILGAIGYALFRAAKRLHPPPTR